VSDRPAPNSTRSRQAAKRFRRRERRLARQLLDQAYAEYLRGQTTRNINDTAKDINSNNGNNSNNENYNLDVSVSSPPPPPSLQSFPSLYQAPSPPRSPTSPLEQPDSPHSAITFRIFPDSPPSSVRSFSPPSYSPISSPEPPRPVSPANSTSSVEFIDEIHIPSLRPRHYYYYDPHQSLDNLILQFLSVSLLFLPPTPSGPTTLISLRSDRLSRVRIPTLSFPFSFLFPLFLMKYSSVFLIIFSHLQQPLSIK